MTWLERRQLPAPIQPGPPPPDAIPALDAWRMMGRTIDWTALPLVVDVLGVDDVELLLANLIVLRDNPELLNHG